MLRCQACGSVWRADEVRYRCDCGGILDVGLALDPGLTRATFEARHRSRDPLDRSGVWRYRELLPEIDPRQVVSAREGCSHHDRHPAVSAFAGAEVTLAREDRNPTGSFEDRGMSVGVTVARALGLSRVACVSTGNSGASLASYAARAGLTAYVAVPADRASASKTAQALAYGARTLVIDGSFDDARKVVQEVALEQDIYLLDSVNPFRQEGLKTVGFELLDELGWQVPDWIVVPGGNLGLVSAIAKGLAELRALNLVPRTGRLAVVQPEGASPLYEAWRSGAELVPVAADTLATALRIGEPAQWRAALRGLRNTNGVVEQVTDREILEAAAAVGRAGVGAEPAACATVAAVRKLVAAGTIRPDQQVVAVLTGHLLKDPEPILQYHNRALPDPAAANPPIRVEATRTAVMVALRAWGDAPAPRTPLPAPLSRRTPG